MNFAVVEDCKPESDLLKTLIEKHCARQHIDCTVSVFHSEEEIRSCFSPGKFDIIFLDVYLGQEEAQGIGLGYEFMKADKSLKTVFCTISPEHAAEGFQINATHYILKPPTEESVSEAFSRLALLMERDAKCMTVSVKHKKISLFLKDIVFAEVYKNQTIVHKLSGEELALSQTLGSFVDDLLAADENASYCFIRCHKSFFVNMHHVVGIDEYGDFIMANGRNVLVRVKNGKTAKRLLHDYRIALASSQ